MTCTCNETRELDEVGEQYEGDFVEDFEAMLDEMDPEVDQEAGPVRRFGDLQYEGEYDGETELIGPDSRVLVTDTTRAPFRYIVNLAYPFRGFGYRSICTGTLIGPRRVLTAAHCLDNLDQTKLRIIPARTENRAPFGVASVAPNGFHPFPSYRPSPTRAVQNTDLAIIYLANDIGKNPNLGWWTRSYRKNKGDEIGTSMLPGSLPMNAGKLKVNLSGYPTDMPADPRLGCRDLTKPANACRGSIVSPRRNALCGTSQFRTYDLTVRLSGRLLYYLNDTCPGHSGSPVWVRRSPDRGGRVLVGVHLGGDARSNVAIFFDKAVRDFIARHTR